jgi:predicted acyl esterase
LEPDKVYPYVIEFWRPTGNRFLAGHQIRVEISSSYYPYYLRNLNTGEDNIGLATKPVVAQADNFPRCRSCVASCVAGDSDSLRIATRISITGRLSINVQGC